MDNLSRRDVIRGAVAVGVGLYAGQQAMAAEGGQPATVPSAASEAHEQCNWVDLQPAGDGMAVGTTWGLPWAKGAFKREQSIRVENEAGQAVAAQVWPTAFWPDGSVKWSAIAVGPAVASAKSFAVRPGEPVTANGPKIDVKQAADAVTVDTGVIQCVVATTGDVLVRSISRDGKLISTNGRLIAIRQDGPEESPATQRQTFAGQIEKVTVEQTGPVRSVVKITGTHHAAERQWLPFVVRLYFYAGSDVVRVMHSFVFDGDEYKDFICGLGIRFDVPMRDELHNRHVRLVGQDHGLFYEAVRPITGLRRDPVNVARQAQVDGVATDAATWATSVSNRLAYIPAWGDFTLSQLSADGFQIRKRTKSGCAWIPAGSGKRSAGVGYVGGASGGLTFGLRNFWQKHPTQLDVRNAATENAEATVWLWSPDARPMDLRMYHDVMGMDTYDKQNEGLNITYEDYEPGYGTPYGVANTSELYFKAEARTPSRQAIVNFADVVRTPPQVMATPERFLQTRIFGPQYAKPDRSTPAKAWVEDRLSGTLDHYLKAIDQHSWYGFWDYGDVMHTYDPDRHVWRYDIGGYAWDNCELSTDLWLWISVLRTGRSDVFRMTEAMCRHTGEVDVYHLGRFKGLGTRHGVQHWSDSSKQSRISTPIYRRIYYYLTADERTGDLLDEQMQTIEAEKKIVVGRKLKPGSPNLPLPPVEMPPPGGEVGLGGMGWGNAMAAWVTYAERRGDAAWHEKIVRSMQGVGELSKGFFTSGWVVNIDTGEVIEKGDKDISLSHLQACFGLPEISLELISLYGEQAPDFAKTWAQYGRLYSGTDQQRRKELGDFPQGTFKGASLRDSHSRCTAFAAVQDKNPDLAKRAWAELLGEKFDPKKPAMEIKQIKGPDSLNPLEEANVGTNGAAQWGLAAMQCLALVGDVAP